MCVWMRALDPLELHRVADNFKLPRGCWELKLGPQEEQPVHLTPTQIFFIFKSQSPSVSLSPSPTLSPPHREDKRERKIHVYA